MAQLLQKNLVSCGQIARLAEVPQFGLPLRSGHKSLFMDRLLSSLKSFVRRNKGQDLLEYALLVALIALASLGAVTASGGGVGDIFGDIAERLGGGSKSNCSSTGVDSSGGKCQ